MDSRIAICTNHYCLSGMDKEDTLVVPRPSFGLLSPRELVGLLGEICALGYVRGRIEAVDRISKVRCAFNLFSGQACIDS